MDTIKLGEPAGAKAPKGLDAVDVVALLVGVLERVVDAVMGVLVEAELGKATPGIGVDHTARLYHEAHDGHERGFVGLFDDMYVNMPATLQDAKYLHFTLGAYKLGFGEVLGVGEDFSQALEVGLHALAPSATKGLLVHLYLAKQAWSLPRGDIDCLSKLAVIKIGSVGVDLCYFGGA